MLKSGCVGALRFIRKKESDELDKSLAVCKLCHTNVKYSGNTTNLRAHLKRHHPDKVMLMLTGEAKKLRQLCGEETFCLVFTY